MNLPTNDEDFLIPFDIIDQNEDIKDIKSSQNFLTYIKTFFKNFGKRHINVDVENFVDVNIDVDIGKTHVQTDIEDVSNTKEINDIVTNLDVTHEDDDKIENLPKEKLIDIVQHIIRLNTENRKDSEDGEKEIAEKNNMKMVFCKLILTNLIEIKEIIENKIAISNPDYEMGIAIFKFDSYLAVFQANIESNLRYDVPTMKHDGVEFPYELILITAKRLNIYQNEYKEIMNDIEEKIEK